MVLGIRYRVVQLNFTPEIEVFYMMFERPLSIFSMTSLKQHIEYSHFRCKILFDLPVQGLRCGKIFLLPVFIFIFRLLVLC